MRPTPYSDIQVDGNMNGEKHAMEIDSGSLAHLMSVLTDLYSDPLGAVVREYSTNARDSHVEAGVARPIEITTPTALAPFLTVRDYGVGLSMDDLVNIYRKYGASTKRDSDDAVGMLGLGSKSGLTYAAQFTITTVKNGVRIVATVSRAADGTGQLEIVDTRATDQPNGVEVKIPAKDAYAIQRKCASFFRFWQAGTVLVDGVEPNKVTGMTVNDSIMVADLGTDYVVMGNVAYPVRDNALSSGVVPAGKSVVAVVPIGAVNFTPSREQLHYTTLTLATLDKVRAELQDALTTAANDAIKNAATHSEALLLADEWGGVILNATFTYRGEAIPTDFSVKHSVWKPNGRRGYTMRRENAYHVSSYLGSKGDSTLFVHGFKDKAGLPYGEVGTHHRTKLNVYLDSLGESAKDYSYILFSDDKIGSPWIEGKRLDWAKVREYKIPRTGASVRATMGSTPIKVWQNGCYIDTDDTYVFQGPFILTSRAARYDYELGASAVSKAFPDHTIVYLGRNRWDKFERLFGSGDVVRDRAGVQAMIDSAVTAAVAGLTDADRMVMHRKVEDTNLAKRLGSNLATLHDKDTRDYLTTISSATLSSAGRQLQGLRDLNGYPGYYRVTIPSIPAPSIQFNVRKRYPLLRQIFSGYGNDATGADVADYMNALADLKGY